MDKFDVRVTDPRQPDLVALLLAHRQEMLSLSPPESVHALDPADVPEFNVTFWGVWHGDRLAGCGALKELDARHGEIKSMRTASEYLRRGVAAEVLNVMLEAASMRGYTRVSLETGSMQAFAPARKLYQRFGFLECGPFGEYELDPHSTFMTRLL